MMSELRKPSLAVLTAAALIALPFGVVQAAVLNDLLAKVTVGVNTPAVPSVLAAVDAESARTITTQTTNTQSGVSAASLSDMMPAIPTVSVGLGFASATSAPVVTFAVTSGTSISTTTLDVTDAPVSRIGAPISNFVKCETLAHVGPPIPTFASECAPATTSPGVSPPGGGGGGGTTTPPGGGGGGGVGGGGGSPSGGGGSGGGSVPTMTSGGGGGAITPAGQVLGASTSTPDVGGVGGGGEIPGVPNTGAGGSAATTISLLFSSGLIALCGLYMLRRISA